MAAPLAVVAGVPAGTIAAAAAAGSEPTGVVDDSLPLAVIFGLC
jgi:hypothetical protein